MLNNVTLMGRITHNLELKTTMSGKCFVRFSIAVNRLDKAKTTDFIDCVSWNKTAEFLFNHFGKGHMLALQGCVQTHTSEKDGQKRKYTQVLISKVYFCGSNKKEEHSTTAFLEDDKDWPFN